MSDFAIRPATVADVPAVRAIYNHYIATSTCTYQVEPETEADRLAWFTNRTAAHPVVVTEAGGEVVGWAALSPWSSRCGYAGTVEASVYVRHDRQRRGLGKALLADLIDRARRVGHHVVIGGASSDQSASLALQMALGFVPVGTFREVGFKFGRRLDVTYSQLILNGG